MHDGRWAPAAHRQPVGRAGYSQVTRRTGYSRVTSSASNLAPVCNPLGGTRGRAVTARPEPCRDALPAADRRNDTGGFAFAPRLVVSRCEAEAASENFREAPRDRPPKREQAQPRKAGFARPPSAHGVAAAACGATAASASLAGTAPSAVTISGFFHTSGSSSSRRARGQPLWHAEAVVAALQALLFQLDAQGFFDGGDTPARAPNGLKWTEKSRILTQRRKDAETQKRKSDFLRLCVSAPLRLNLGFQPVRRYKRPRSGRGVWGVAPSKQG